MMSLFQLVFYVPSGYAEEVKHAVFCAGAGRVGNYDQCCWETEGRGQFRPLAGSQPFLGEKNTLEYVAEKRIEMVVDGRCADGVINALRRAHPYEEPAFSLLPLSNPPKEKE
ncbi:NGG1p interacting factor 3 protein, NIF3 [Teredinibacter turnerae]|uniref:NGG1p interacting factor 3 protein, NIF3 n=1 Tax=Teredinibacter turnerae TaxID=2426 RepID=UPI00059F6C03|nr:NGG1p interacting factor 3 protein, NIF3 [Teredinibacter turnerae]